MRRFYGIDVRGLWTGDLTIREIAGYLSELPDESRTRKKIAGPVAAWSQEAHLLAVIVDQLAAANWMYVSAHSGENTTIPPAPEPIRRPGDPSPDDPVTERTEDEKQKIIREKFGTAAEQAQKVMNLLGKFG